MGVQITYSPKTLSANNSVWVDPVYGDDSLGLMDRRDFPFATIAGAWAAIHASGGGSYIIYLASGTYTVANTLLCVSGYNYKFVNESKIATINFTPLPANNQSLFERSPSVLGAISHIEIIGGIWNNTAGTGTMFNSGGSFVRHKYTIKDADINDLTGANVFYKAEGVRLENCRVISTVGNIFTGGQTPADGVISRSYLEATAGDIIGSQDALNFKLISSYAYAPAGSYHDNRFGTFDFYNSTVSTFNTCITGIQTQIRCTGGSTKFIVSQDVPVIEVNTYYTSGDADSLLIFDNVLLSQPIYSTAPCIFLEQNTTASTRFNYPVRLVVTGTLAFNDGSEPAPFTNYPAGAIGIQLTTATAGNTITLDLPNAYSGSPINVLLSTSDIATSIAEIKAAVDAQVLTPGTTWADWCKGDTNNVEILTFTIANDGIRVRGGEGIPAGYRIKRSGGTYFTLNADTGVTKDVAPSLIEIAGGKLLPIDNNLIRYNAPTVPISAVTYVNAEEWRTEPLL